MFCTCENPETDSCRPWYCSRCNWDIPEEVYISGLNGKRISMHACVWNTDIGSVKDFIARTEGIPVSRQHLAYGGRILPNHRLLSRCGIHPRSVIHLFVINHDNGGTSNLLCT